MQYNFARWRSHTFATLFLCAAFLTSWFLTSKYTLGDQEHYRYFYDSLKGTNILDVPYLQLIHTGSAEPLFGPVMWVGASLGLDKDIYVSVFNTALIALITRFLISRKASIPFIALSLSNYYLIVLLTSAERLKFGYIFLALSLNIRPLVPSVLTALASTLFHFQTTLLLFARACSLLSRSKLSSISPKNLIIGALLSFLSLVLIAVVAFSIPLNDSTSIADVVQIKLQTYFYQSRGIASTFNIIALLAISIITLPKKFEAVAAMMVCALFAYFLGGERVNMIAVSIYFYFAVRDNVTSHPVTLALMLYFSVKSIDYVYRVVVSGTGF